MALALFCFHLTSGLRPVVEQTPQKFVAFDLGDLLQHLDDLSEAEIDTRLEHQFTLLDQDKDGILKQQERTEIWVDFLQPIAQLFFPETDMLTFEDFCEKDHRLVPSELTGDEHFFTIEKVCQWEDHVADESCESDWEVLFADANEISRNEFIQRFVEVLNVDNFWTFANYKELMMSKERKHFRQLAISSDESSLVPVNQFAKKSESVCTELHPSRRELGFILSALGTVLAILLSSAVAGLSAGVNAGCEGNCFDGGAFNMRNFLIEGTIAFGSSALITSTCVVTSGLGCVGAGVGAGVLASIAQGTVCELQPDDWNYVPGQTGCTQDCCWQPETMISNVVMNTISAGLQTSAVRNFVVNGLDNIGLPATSALSTNLFGVKGGILPEWGFTGLAHAQYGMYDVGMAAALAALGTGGWSSHAINELWKTGEQMQRLSEYHSVVLQPNQFSDQVSLLNEVRRDIDAQNLGLPCAQYCSHSGQCSFCGNSYCCEKGVVSHGCDGTVGGDSMRVCVAMTIGESEATIDGFKEKAMVELKFSHVQLTNFPWCIETNPYISKPEVRLHYELKMPEETCRGNTDFFGEGFIVNPLGPGNAMNHRIIQSEAECREAAKVFSNEPMEVNPTWGTHPFACSIKFQGNKRIPIWNDRRENYGIEDSSRICYRHDPLPTEDFVEDRDHHTWKSKCTRGTPKDCPSSYHHVAIDRCSWPFWEKRRHCQKYTWECPSGYSVVRCSWNEKDHAFNCNRHAMCRKDDMSWENESTERVNGRIVYPTVLQAQPEKCADKGYELDINTEFETFEDAMSHCMSSPSCGAVYNHWPLNCRFFADVAHIDDTFNMPEGCEYVTEAGSGLKKDMFYAIKLADPQNFCPIQSDPDARISNFKTLRADGNFVMLQGKEYNGNVADCADHYNYFTYYPFVTDQEEVWASSKTGWANLLGFVHGFAVDMDHVKDVGIVRQTGLSQVLPLIIPSQKMECSEHRWTPYFECPWNYAIQGFFTYGNEEFSWVRCCQGVIEDSCHWESQSDIQRMECSNAGYVWAGLRSSGNKFEHIDSWKCCEVPPTFGTAAMTAVGHMCKDNAIISSFRTTSVPGPTVDLVAPYLEQCHAACDSDLSCTHFGFRPAIATLTDLGEIKNGLGFCTLYHSRCETLIPDSSNILLFQMNKRMEMLELLSSVKPAGCSLKDEATWINIQEPMGHGIGDIHNTDVYLCAKACAANGYSTITFGQANNDIDMVKCLCRDNIPSLSSCSNLDLTVRAELGQPEFHLSSNPNTLTVFTISSMNKITAIQTNNGTLYVDIGRARFNDLFDKCPVVALNTAEGQSIYRRTANWTNELDAYSLFTFEFRGSGNLDGDYVTYKCNGGSCEIAEVRQWMDVEDIRSRTDNPEIHLYLFPANACPTNFDVNVLPCDATPQNFKIKDAVKEYGGELVRIKQQEAADITLGITSPGRSPAAAYSSGLLFSKTYENGLCGTSVVEDLGTIIGRGAHTTYIRLDFPTEDPIRRQWILNIGQEGMNAEHWIWNGHSSQLGSWGVLSINTYISNCNHLAMTYDGINALKCYCDGLLKEQTNVVIDIKNSNLLVGGNRGYESETGKFQGCIHEVTVWNKELSSEEINALVSSHSDCMWVQKDGYYVQEGHNNAEECYSTLKEAQTECDKSQDCNAIATQSNVCGGQYRVTHGGPTLVYFSNWIPHGIRAWERVCVGTETRAYLPDVLGRCQESGTLSKHDNGCLAYHRGWKKGDYNCAHCGGTSRNYAACDIEECKRLCADLYSENLSQSLHCKEGCEKYHELGGCLEKREPSDVLLQCEEWGTLSKNHNGCRAYHRGWEKGEYGCAHCGETSRDYAACDLEECKRLCADLYSENLSQSLYCNEGCEKYHELGGCLGIITTQLDQINDIATEIVIAGEVRAEHAGCAWECSTNSLRIEVTEPSVSACTKLASQRGSDFFAIDSTGACLFPDDYPEVFAFDECPMSHTCNKDYYTVATNWENFECSAFNQVLDKNSDTFQSCNNHPSYTTESTIIEDCETACNLLSGCSYFIFTQSLSECLLFTTCELSFEPYMHDGVTSVLMRRGMGDALNDQVPRLISSDEPRDTMVVRSPDARNEAYVSCPVGFLVIDCLCALDSCKGASISGRYCTAFGDFVAAQATCLRETFVNSHSFVTQDSASFDCGSDTVLGCTCSSKRLDDCDVVFEDGQCRLRPLSTGDVAYERSCISGSCSDGWQHLQVFDGYMIEVQSSNQRITIPKGSYNVETLRKMLPDYFDWNSSNIVAFRQSDDRHVQAICADARPNFNPGN